MLEVRIIKPEMTYNLRHQILRPHQALEDCQYETDQDAGSFHIGAFYGEKLISVASFCIDNNPDFSSDKQYRLRAMATLEAFRRVGAGRAIVKYAESLIKEQRVDLLWCKGRTNVQEYYQKLGFKPHGDVFDYPPIGPHIIMYKKFSSIPFKAVR